MIVFKTLSAHGIVSNQRLKTKQKLKLEYLKVIEFHNQYRLLDFDNL